MISNLIIPDALRQRFISLIADAEERKVVAEMSAASQSVYMQTWRQLVPMAMQNPDAHPIIAESIWCGSSTVRICTRARL